MDVSSERQQRFRVPGEGGSLAPGGPTSAAVASRGAQTGDFSSTSVPVARKRVCVEKVVAGSFTVTAGVACVNGVPTRAFIGTGRVSQYDAEQRKTAGFGLTEKDGGKVKGSVRGEVREGVPEEREGVRSLSPRRL